MRKLMLLFIGFMLAFTVGFVSANVPFKVFVEDKAVKDTGEYIIKGNKVYVSQDALKNDFGFAVFYDQNENKISLYDINKTALKARNKLFEEFVACYDPKTPDEVAELWARGIKERNGVFQYVSLDNQLKKDFKDLAKKQNRFSWITGFSSPWVEDYKITKKKLNENTWEYGIVFKAASSIPETYTWNAKLIVSNEENKWRIVDIKKDFDSM
jgi:hypothetical protein